MIIIIVTNLVKNKIV